MQSNFRMVMRSGPSVGKVYPLDKGEMFVGRDLSNDIVINDPEISRRHARLFQQGNGYVLEDLGSTNGSFVNGQRLVGPNILRPGDSITFGERMSMVFESSDYDQDATMISPASRPAYGAPPPQPGQGQAQVYDSGQASYNQPAQQPAYNPPPAAQAPQQGSPAAYPPRQPVDQFAGQVPSSYAPEMVVPERRIPTMWIVLGILLLLSCLCLFIGAWNAPRWFWCMLPIWPAGACP